MPRPPGVARSPDRALVALVAAILPSTSWGTPPGPGAATAVPAPTVDAAALARRSLRDCELPPGLQLRWDAGTLDDDTLVEAMLALRAAEPGTFAATALPPAGVRLVADHEPMGVLHLVYPGWPDHDDAYGAILAAATRHGTVEVVPLLPSSAARLERLLVREGVPADRVRVRADPEVETVWMRDYGPIPVATPQGPGVLDTRYSVDCLGNDAWPTRAATSSRVWRPPLYIDGGNLLTDGAGTCYTTTQLLDDNGVGKPELARLLAEWGGCVRTHVLEPLRGNVIEHIDMILAVAPDGTLLTTRFDSHEDPVNYAIMKRNRARLTAEVDAAGRPLRVVDVPAAPPLWADGDGPLVRPYVNLLPFNDLVLVPSYSLADPERAAIARVTIAAAFPDREVVEVPSDALIAQHGAVHCVARATPEASSLQGLIQGTVLAPSGGAPRLAPLPGEVTTAP